MIRVVKYLRDRCGLPVEQPDGPGHGASTAMCRTRNDNAARVKIGIAPLAPTLIPRGLLTVPAIVTLVLMKFLWDLPIHRLVALLATQGCAISADTLVGVLKRLPPLLAPLQERNRAEPRLHADESCWQVYAETAAKTGHQWLMWVFHGVVTTVFVLDPSRSARVPRTHLQLDAETGSPRRRRWTLIPDNYVVPHPRRPHPQCLALGLYSSQIY